MRTFAPLAIAHLARAWERALILTPDHSTSPRLTEAVATCIVRTADIVRPTPRLPRAPPSHAYPLFSALAQ